MLAWLLGAAVGPAAVALPVNWTADALAGAARRWFRRFRRVDDLSRLVRSASGVAVELTQTEFDEMRRLLEEQQTWDIAGRGTVEDLTNKIASCLPARNGQAKDSLHLMAETIARGLLEFAVKDLEPGLFQQVLLTRLQRMETDQASAFDKAMLDLHADLAFHFAELNQYLNRILIRLSPGPAKRSEMVVYLRTLRDWLNADLWPRDRQYGYHAPTPTDIERKLHVKVDNGEGDNGVTKEWDADLLAQKCQRLVILGDPGSGKTWLAKRTARRCANAALRSLEEGADLDEIELPLYTTCSDLFSAGGSIRTAVVSSALNQVGDLGGARLTEAIHRSFTDRDAPTLLIIDSLDEAHGSDKRIRQADTLPWRIILTSRRSAWNYQLTINTENDLHRVGELQRLRYPDDVESVIQRWFILQPARAKELAGQIARRPDLQQAVTVPLILAFSCIIGGNEPLPYLQRDLYNKVLRRILTGRWRGGNDPGPDIGTCLDTLRAWAWEGAVTDHFSGIATWIDKIPISPVGLGEAEAAAVGHVAAPADPRPDDDSGKEMRRFIHRSIREYLVAGHIASLTVDQAVEKILPHLWYDTDWEYLSPAAIVMHPHCDLLLRKLICRAASIEKIPSNVSAIDVGGQLQDLLARLALETGADDWSPEIAGLICQALEDHPGWDAADYVEKQVWGRSNSAACEALLTLLTDQSKSWMADAIVGRLAGLVPTAEDKREIRAALLRLLTNETRSEIASKMVDMVIKLEPTAGEKHDACEKLLALLAHATRVVAAKEFVGALVELDPTAEEKRRAREALHRVRKMQTGDWASAAKMLLSAVKLDPTAEDLRRARKDLLWLLNGEIDLEIAADLVDAAVGLAPEADDKRYVREALLMILADADPQLCPALASGVVRLGPATESNRQAYETLLNRLSFETDHQAGAHLVTAALQLDLTAEDRRETRQILLRMLDEAEPPRADDLVDRLSKFASHTREEYEVRKALLTLLAGHPGSYMADKLLDGITKLGPTAEDLCHARAALLKMLDEADPHEAARLVDSLIQVAPTADSKRDVSKALLMRLAPYTERLGSYIDRRVAAKLVGGLSQLASTPEDRRQALEALLVVLTRETDRFVAEDLMGYMVQLDLTAQDKARARQALLGLMASNTPNLARGFTRLDPTAKDKRQARAIVLRLLTSQSDPWEGQKLMYELVELDPNVRDLDTWPAELIEPSGELLAAVRRNSKLTDWLAARPLLTSLRSQSDRAPAPLRGRGLSDYA